MSTHSMQEVPMKFAVVRRGEVVEMRRRRLVNPTYEVVAKVAAEFARGKYRLQYTDEDGDVVTMSTQAEWEECVASWDAAQALKIRVELCGAKGWCGSRSRSRSSSSACSRTKQGCRSWSPRRHHGHGHEHHPLRVRAWLAKKEAQAWDVPAEVGVKCANCDCQTTGITPGFCCKKCMRGCKGHGRRCEQKPFVPQSEEPVNSSQGHASPHAPLQNALLFRGCPLGAFGMRGLFGHVFGHGKGHKGMHGHGTKACKKTPHEPQGCKGAVTIGQKCANCAFQTTGIVDLFCCRACMNGEGHGLFCKQLPMEEMEDAQAQQVEIEAADPETEEKKAEEAESPCPVPVVEDTKAPDVDVPSCDESSAEESNSATAAPEMIPFASQIAQLETMGFTVNAQVINALVAADGNISVVLSTLLL